MNLSAAGQIGIYLLWKGGPAAISDAGTLYKAYTAVKGGQTIDAVATPAVEDAFTRTANLLAGLAADPSGRANMMALATSF